MENDTIISEQQDNITTQSVITNRKDVSIINDKTMSEVIELLYETMKDETDNIDMISRKSLIELSETNLSLVIKIGIETIRNLISPTNTNANVNNYLINYTNLLQEVIEKYGINLDRTTYKISSTFVIDSIQLMINNQTSGKDIEKSKLFEKKINILTKLLIFISNFYFADILSDIMQLFSPGSVPNKIIIELLTEMALTYPIKSSQNYQEVVSRTLPILASIQDENTRVVFSKFFAQVCESLLISIDSKEDSTSIVSKQGSNFDSLTHLFATAFDLIYAQWLINCKNFGNKIHIVNALIMMGSLLPDNSIRNNLENIVNLFVNNLKKDQLEGNIILCKSFRIFFENSVITYKERLEMNIISLMTAVFPILTNVNISPNVREFDPIFMQVKSELLKLFFLLFKNYLDKTFSFLVSRFEVIPLMERLTNIYLIKTMLLRSDPLNSTYRDMLLSAISKATHENDLEFKYALFELIYILFEKNLLTQESSIKLISYLVKEAGYSDDEIYLKDEKNKNYPFYTNLKILRDKSENVLLDIINKIPESDNYFWPHILDYLYDYKYDGSVFIICKMIIALKLIKENKMEEMLIDFDQFTNLPSNYQILIKLFIILSNPSRRVGLSTVTLNCVNVLVPLLNADLKRLKIETHEIEQYLKRGKYFDYNIYDDILLTIWEKILLEMKNFEFITSITESIVDNIGKYKDDLTTVGFLMRMQGVVLAKLNKREVVKNILDNLFNFAHPEFKNDQINGNLNSASPSKEIRLGVAEAFGLTAKTHLDIILDKINAIFKSEIKFQKASGFAGLFASSKDPEMSPHIITTLITALGSIAKFADPNLLSSRINSNFLSHIDTYFRDDKSPKPLKYACVVSLGNIFKALQKLSSFYIDKGDIFILQNRDLYLDNMVKIFKNEKSLNEMKIAALNNISYLIKLDPPVGLEQCKNFIYLAFVILDHKDLMLDNEIKERALEAMNNILESILVHDNHFTSSLDQISITADNFVVVSFENIINYDKDILTSWDFFSLILEKFVERYLKDNDTVKDKEYNNKIKTIIIERVEIFINSKKSVKFTKEEFPNWVASLICLLTFFFDENNTDNEGTFLCISRLLTGLDVFEIFYNSNLSIICEELSNVFKYKLSKDNFLFIFQKLFYLLKNKSTFVNKYSSILVERLLTQNTEYFASNSDDNIITKAYQLKLESAIEGLINVLEYISKDEGNITSERYNNVLKITEEFSKINLTQILDACLKEEYGLPLPVSLTSILHKICKEKILITKIFTKITDIINNGDPGFENKPNYCVCASTVVLGTMLQTHDPVITPLIKKFFPQLLSTLLLRIGSSHSINYTVEAFKSQSEDPRNQTVWTLQQLMTYSEEEDLSTCLESGGSIQNKLMNSYEYDEGIYELMLIYCKKNDHVKQSSMYDFLSGFLDRPWSGQRVVVVSCYAQFVNFASVIHCKNTDFDIVEWRNKLILELTKTITDSDELARKQSIRGLANLCRVFLDCTVYIENYIRITEKLDIDAPIEEEKKELVKKNLKKEMLEASYGTSIINLLIEKLSDNTESVVLESLNSLQQMMEFLTMKAIIPCISNLLVKLRPCFDINNHNVRSLGFNLFNRIISLVNLDGNQTTNNPEENKIEEIIKEQIHLHLISVLLHTNDEKPGVRNNCFKTLIKALKVLLNEDVTRYMDEAKNKYGDDYNRCYDDFIKNVSKLITEKYANKIPYHISNCINHALSPQDTIRASSVYLIGVFYDNLVVSEKNDVLKTINLENVFNNFSKLLKDYSTQVKIKTIKSLAFFKHIKASNYK